MKAVSTVIAPAARLAGTGIAWALLQAFAVGAIGVVLIGLKALVH